MDQPPIADERNYAEPEIDDFALGEVLAQRIEGRL